MIKKGAILNKRVFSTACFSSCKVHKEFVEKLARHKDLTKNVHKDLICKTVYHWMSNFHLGIFFASKMKGLSFTFEIFLKYILVLNFKAIDANNLICDSPNYNFFANFIALWTTNVSFKSLSSIYFVGKYKPKG